MLSHRLSQGQRRWKVGGWRKWGESNKGEKTTVGYKWYGLGREINKPCLLTFVSWCGKKITAPRRSFVWSGAEESEVTPRAYAFVFFFTFNVLFREAVSRGVMKRAYGGHVSEDVGIGEGLYKRYNHMAKARRKVNWQTGLPPPSVYWTLPWRIILSDRLKGTFTELPAACISQRKATRVKSEGGYPTMTKQHIPAELLIL